MARNDPQFNLRISQELRDRLEIEAKNSGRSITQEIIKRLEHSLLDQSIEGQVIRESLLDEPLEANNLDHILKSLEDVQSGLLLLKKSLL